MSKDLSEVIGRVVPAPENFLSAEKLEAEAKAWDEKSDEQMHQHHRWAQATTVLQVAIAMAAIALLSKKKWLEYVMYIAGAGGVVIGVLAYLHI